MLMRVSLKLVMQLSIMETEKPHMAMFSSGMVDGDPHDSIFEQLYDDVLIRCSNKIQD